MWERRVQECYCAWHCHRTEIQSVRKTTYKSKSWWNQLLMAADVEWPIHENKHQQSVNNLWSCKCCNWTVICSRLCISDVLTADTVKRASNMVTAQVRESASTERQWLLALHCGEFKFRLVADIHLWDNGSLYCQKQQRHAPCCILKMRVNRASTVLAPSYMVIKASGGSSRSEWNFWLPW